ncbi:MAG TPA: ABC transporter ATP-binding protein [Verrucomicrobiae bacterium]|nr:ABC transporter ATP-binding protein [Verrucomicrobiae bacterium]
MEGPPFAPRRRARSDAPYQQPVQGVKARHNWRSTILEVSHLRVERGGTTILDGVSWQVERGQHWVILGANGSGKTSLLSALTGYLTPTAGEISLLSRTYGRSDWRELRKQIGLVSSAVRQMMADHEPALETVASGKYAMIDFWGTLSRADKNRALRILRQIECMHLAARPWRVLSQGERQRVLIGRALVAKPKVLILDEPCAGLDPAAREHFLQFLQRLGQSKNAPTLVLVTHHVEEIMPVFSHVLLLKHGCVLASGKKTNALNSRNLSHAFNARMKLQTAGKRYGLKVQANYTSSPVL